MIYDVSIENTNYRLELNRTTTGWTCSLNGRPVQLDVALIRPGVLSLLIENQAYEVKREKVGSEIHLWVGNQRYTAELRDPRSLRNLKDGAGRQQGSSRLTAPLPGKVVRLLVNEKDQVAGEGSPFAGERKRPGRGRPGGCGCGSHEDAERDQVPQERHSAEAHSRRGHQCERRRRASDCGMNRARAGSL